MQGGPGTVFAHGHSFGSFLVPLRSDGTYTVVSKTVSAGASRLLLAQQVLGFLPSAPFTNVRMLGFGQGRMVALNVTVSSSTQYDIDPAVPAGATAILCNIFTYNPPSLSDHMVHTFGRVPQSDNYVWDNQVGYVFGCVGPGEAAACTFTCMLEGCIRAHGESTLLVNCI